MFLREIIWFSWLAFFNDFLDENINAYVFVFLIFCKMRLQMYSHLFNKRGGLNKRGGGAKVAKSLNVEFGINVEGGIFWKKLVHNSNKRGVEGGKI